MAPVKLSIPTTHTATDASSKPYTTYSVLIQPPFPHTTTTLTKRYSDFAALDSSLRSAVSAPPVALPGKAFLGGLLGLGGTNSADAIEKRRVGLESYLRGIENSPDPKWRTNSSYLSFLNLKDTDSHNASSALPGSQFGKDRIRDAPDWLDKLGELKACLGDARRALAAREGAGTQQAQHERGVEAKRSLVRAGTLVGALEEGLGRLSGGSRGGGNEWGGEKLGEGEARRRRDLLSGLKKERDGLEAVLGSMAVKTAHGTGSSGSGASYSGAGATTSVGASEAQKSALFSGASKPAPSHARRVLGGPAPETERTRELDNAGVLQLQKQIIAEQDEDLVDLTTVVRRMREMGVQINQELVEQNAMLGLLEGDVERVDGKIRVAKKRIGKIK